MNVRRFVGRNAREAMARVRATWGDHAVVLSNRPVPGGVEILAMPGAEVPPAAANPEGATTEEAAAAPMSTVSFQQFVRERMRHARETPVSAPVPTPEKVQTPAQPKPRTLPREPATFAAQALALEISHPANTHAQEAAPDVMTELRAMRSLLSSQLSGLSWFDGVRRNPEQTQLLRLMIGNGFSPAVSRQLVDRLPEGRSGAAASQWLREVIARNLRCATGGEALLERGGVHALVGPTGVGKTTTCAKLAAEFARRHGAASVGLITVDTYRMAASDQLRAFGRLLNIPVHTARDGAALTELLDLFEKKKLVLIDTVGVGQRDKRLAELFAALPENRVERLLVLNAAAQAETLEEVVRAYGGRGSQCVITKVDEAARFGGVIDVALRQNLVVQGFANGQRVPEDWHAPSAQLLVQKALMRPTEGAYGLDDAELALVVTAPRGTTEARNA